MPEPSMCKILKRSKLKNLGKFSLGWFDEFTCPITFLKNPKVFKNMNAHLVHFKQSQPVFQNIFKNIAKFFVGEKCENPKSSEMQIQFNQINLRIINPVYVS